MLTLLRTSATALMLGAFVAPALTAADAPNFKETVWPIIDTACVKCHGAEKQKGKLRLDSKEAWLKGGENGKMVEPGAPENSDVMKMISYTYKDSDYHMPPPKKGKETKLSAEQIAVIEAWIKAGMPWDN